MKKCFCPKSKLQSWDEELTLFSPCHNNNNNNNNNKNNNPHQNLSEGGVLEVCSLVGTPPLQMVDDILGIQQCSRKSLNLNTVINTFIDVEKLKLSSAKCHNVHIGRDVSACHTLKVHGSPMAENRQEKYLGDIIDNSGKSEPNIEKRKSRGFGIVANILAIINEIPLRTLES